ncbi:hypothetical protein BB558_005070 [Smittium angustum]|uniref:C2H2-type domain-containing protein n=1 Tax=Smittium angustum TaxID=133377 RepID=A0A2U1J1J3_SMIAN|nr:hypothetical protein BB558_005070 [Smittium angustum]
MNNVFTRKQNSYYHASLPTSLPKYQYYPNAVYPNSAYQNTAYPNSAYQNTAYPKSAYQNTAYPNTTFQNTSCAHPNFQTHQYSSKETSLNLPSMKSIISSFDNKNLDSSSLNEMPLHSYSTPRQYNLAQKSQYSFASNPYRNNPFSRDHYKYKSFSSYRRSSPYSTSRKTTISGPLYYNNINSLEYIEHGSLTNSVNSNCSLDRLLNKVDINPVSKNQEHVNHHFHKHINPGPNIYNHTAFTPLVFNKSHIINNNSGVKSAVCRWNNCSESFYTLSHLMDHMVRMHVGRGKSFYVCGWSDCLRENKPFTKRHKLLNHLRTHTGERPFTCTFPNCRKQFSRPDSLQTHALYYSQKAEEYEDSGKLELAYEAHKTSAEHYYKILENTVDPVNVNALNGLWITQCQRARLCKTSHLQQKANKEQTEFEDESAGSLESKEKKELDTLEQDFENFWNYIENWVSNPIAFTSSKLDNSHYGKIVDSFYFVSQDMDQSGLNNVPTNISLYPNSNQSENNNETKQESEIVQKHVDKDEEINTKPQKVGPSSGGFKSRVEKTEYLERENDALKQTIKQLSTKVTGMESAKVENFMLKSSIFKLKEEFNRHAKHLVNSRYRDNKGIAGGSREQMFFGNSQDGNYPEDCEVEEKNYQSLKNEIKELREKNEEQAKVIEKYKSRWEKLKESAKKKRQQQTESKK